MSNRALIISIIAIVVVFAGVVAIVRYQNNKQISGTQENQSAEQLANQNPPNQAPASPAETAPSSTPPTAMSTAANETCQRDFNAGKLAKNSSLSLANREVTINVKDFGDITLQFYDKDAPKAVENFLRLADSGYYDCLTFHRVAKGFVIQGGDPNGDGSGGQSAFGAPFADELNPDTPSYKAGYVKGVLAMANSGPNTNGSQFFIMLGDVPLDHKYTIFGKVTVGQDVVDKIGQVDITPVMGPTDGSPKTPVVMQSVKIIK